MAEIVNIAQFFLLSLALGVGSFSWIAKSEMTGAGFQKLISSVCLGSLAIGLLVHLSRGALSDPQSISYVIAFVCFGLIRQLHQDKKSILMWILYVVHTLVLLNLLFMFLNNSIIHFSFGLTSVLLTGVITYSMTLGHYYLVVPKLSVRPLKIALIITWCLLAIKIVWSGYELSENMHYFAEQTRYGGGYAFNWLMLTMRVVWGYVIIFAMSVFTWKLVKIRSTQSATGVLYAMTIFIFIGEMISSYLFFKFGLLI